MNTQPALGTPTSLLPNSQATATRPRPSHTQRGFTLVELMVTVVIVAIVMGIGLPNFRDGVKRNRLVSQSNELASDMNFARTQAVMRGVKISICPSDPSASGNGGQTQCTTPGTGGWNGWIVFTDPDDSCTYDLNTEIILRRHGDLAGNTLTANFTGGDRCAGYKPGGFSSSANPVTLKLCDTVLKQKNLKTLDLQIIGQIFRSVGDCP